MQPTTTNDKNSCEGNVEEQKLERVIYTRITPEMKQRLDAIASRSVARNISDHIRFALEKYIKEQESNCSSGVDGDTLHQSKRTQTV